MRLSHTSHIHSSTAPPPTQESFLEAIPAIQQRTENSDCHFTPELESYHKGLLDDLRMEVIESHIFSCDDCRDELVRIGLDSDLGKNLAAKTWGSSIAVVVLRCFDSDPHSLPRIRAALNLTSIMWTDFGQNAWYGIWDTSTLRAGGSPISSSKLMPILHILAQNITGSSVGAYVDADRGGIEHEHAYGVVCDRIEQYHAQLVRGDLLVAPELGAYLDPSLVRQEAVTFKKLTALKLLPVKPAIEIMISESGQKDGKVIAKRYFSGVIDEISRWVEFVVSPKPAFRDVDVEAARFLNEAIYKQDPSIRLANFYPLQKQDVLEVEFSNLSDATDHSAEPYFSYLLVQRAGSFRVWSEGIESYGKEHSSQRRPLSRCQIVVDDSPGWQRPLLLATSKQLPNLASDLCKIQAESVGAEQTLINLIHYIRKEYNVENMMLCDYGIYPHSSSNSSSGISESDFQAHILQIDKDINNADIEAGALECTKLLRGELSSEQIVQVCIKYAAILRRQQKPQEAVRQLERALQVIDSLEIPIDRGETLRELAWCQLETQEIPLARENVTEALAIHRKSQDQWEEARDLQCLARTDYVSGNLSDARKHYFAAAEMAKQLKFDRLLASAFSGVGSVFVDLGKFTEARRYFSEAAQLFERIDDRRGLLHGLIEAGTLELDQQEHGKAIKIFQRALKLAEDKEQILRRQVIRLALTRAYIETHRYNEARKQLQAAYDYFSTKKGQYYHCACWLFCELALRNGDSEEVFSWLERLEPLKDLHFETQWRAALTRAEWMARNQDPKAESAFLEGICFRESERYNLPLSLRANFLDTSTRLFSGWVEQLLARQASADELLNAVERSRARAFVEALAASEDSSDQDSFKDKEFARRLISGTEDVGTIRRRLPSNVTFIEFFSLPDRLLAFRLNHLRCEYRVIEQSREELSFMATRIMNYFGHIPPDTDGYEQALPVLLPVTNAVLTPLMDWLEELPLNAELGIIAHGPLTAFPFHALPMPNKTKHIPMVMEYVTFYAPSLQAVSRWLNRKKSKLSDKIVLANPTKELKGADEEAERLRIRWNSENVLKGDDVTADTIKREAEVAYILHLAMHGFPARRGVPARLSLTPMSGDLSEKAENDLEASAIVSWILDAYVVVISACWSGAGDYNPAGDGLDLMSLAFLAAGARSVVAAHWTVGDGTAAVLMDKFYENLLCSGMSKVRALTEAQRAWFNSEESGIVSSSDAVRSENQSVSRTKKSTGPLHWASFFIIGDWR